MTLNKVIELVKKDDKKKKSGNGEDREIKDTALGEGTKKDEEELINKLQEEIDKLTTKDIIVQMMMSFQVLHIKRWVFLQG